MMQLLFEHRVAPRDVPIIGVIRHAKIAIDQAWRAYALCLGGMSAVILVSSGRQSQARDLAAPKRPRCEHVSPLDMRGGGTPQGALG
jgi:hypothetical protein